MCRAGTGMDLLRTRLSLLSAPCFVLAHRRGWKGAAGAVLLPLHPSSWQEHQLKPCYVGCGVVMVFSN